MFLKNQVVYIQFHPVVYIVKLKIEMSMASLVVRIAKGKPENDMDPEDNFKDSSHHSTAKSVHMHSPPMKPKLLAGNVKPNFDTSVRETMTPNVGPASVMPIPPNFSTHVGAMQPSVTTTITAMRPTTAILLKPSVGTTVMAMRPTTAPGMRPPNAVPKGKHKVNLYPQPFSNVMVTEKKLPHVPVEIRSVFEDDKSPKKGVMHVFLHGHGSHHKS